MKKVFAMVLGLSAFALASLPANSSSPHPPIKGGHGPGFFYPTAGAVSYFPGQTAGLNAVFSSSVQFGISHTPGYLVTGGPAGEVGWNIPSVGGGNATLPQFYGAKFSIASPTNFSNTVPFKIVVQTADGVVHTCRGNKGTYSFTPAQSGGTAFSSFTAYSTQFTPPMNLGDSTIQKLAFIYTGNKTVGLCGGVALGGMFSLTPDLYSYATTPNTKFNFQ